MSTTRPRRLPRQRVVRPLPGLLALKVRRERDGPEEKLICGAFQEEVVGQDQVLILPEAAGCAFRGEDFSFTSASSQCMGDRRLAVGP